MKQSLILALALYISACSVIPTQNAPAISEPVSPPNASTPTVDLIRFPPPTSTMFGVATATPILPTLIPTSTPTYEEQIIDQTQAPVLAATLIIPTLQTGKLIKLSSIKMIDPQVGWGIYVESGINLRPGFRGDPLLSSAEGYILRTMDGGKTWKNVTPSNGAYSSAGFFALDADHAWASYNVPCCTDPNTVQLWRTSDGGETWQASQPFYIKHVNRSEFYLPVQIQFIDEHIGWLLSSSEASMHYSLRDNLLFTTNGGDTWITINYDLGSCWNGGIAFVNAKTGWFGTSCVSDGFVMSPFSELFGEGGWKVRHSTDGRNSFTFSTLIPTTLDLQKLTVTNPDMDCGETRVRAFTPMTIGIEWECQNYTTHERYKFFSLSTDGGQIWTTEAATGNEFFLDTHHGWRLQPAGELQETNPLGSGWVNIKTVSWTSAQFDFVNQFEGWALVSNGEETALVHTNDGGRKWEEIKSIIAP